VLIFDWCQCGVSLSFRRNFNKSTILVFIKTTCISCNKNEIIKKSVETLRGKRVFNHIIKIEIEYIY
jgi:hypothetical protein